MNVTMDDKIVLKTCVFYDAVFKRLARFPSKLYFANAILNCVINILLTVTTISLNATTLMACLRSKKLKTKEIVLPDISVVAKRSEHWPIWQSWCGCTRCKSSAKD